MDRRRFRRGIGTGVVVAFLTATSATAYAFDSSVVRSMVMPGSGQAQNGHYTKAALFAGLAIAAGAGLLASQVHYNRAVDRYETQKRIYLDYPRLLDSGNVFAEADIESTYRAMSEAFDEADSRVVWRNVFLGALITTYALNVVDVLLSRPDTGEIEHNGGGVSLELRGDDVMLVKSFSF